MEGLDWLNLNGPWQFRFDPDYAGINEGWYQPGEYAWREQIIVPFCWESLAAWGEGDSAGNDHYYATRVFRNPLEVTRENHRSAQRYEVGWYRRQIDIPSELAWEGKRVILTLGASDFYTDCWCNGMHLGHHEGGYNPFEFDLTDALQSNKNGSRRALVVLRVEDPMDNSEQPVGKQWRWYTTTSGIWQTVFVEPRHTSHVHSFRFTGDVDQGTTEFEATCRNADGCRLEVEIQCPDGHKQTALLEVIDGQARRIIKLAALELWEPNRPSLYDARLRMIRDNEAVDSVTTYFGMRKIDFSLAQESGVPSSIRINNQPRYLRGALYQSYHPDGVYTAGSVETIKDDITFAKKFGFNFLRVHIKIDDPMVLYWADKIGVLLMADLPNFGEGGDTSLGRQRFEAMLRETIERDYNHPSIIAWCLFNETWGFGGQSGYLDRFLAPKPAPTTLPPSGPQGAWKQKHSLPDQAPVATSPQQWVQEMWELAKSLDHTRLVEDMSVCQWEHLEYYQHCDTDIDSWHFYISDYEKAKAHIEKIVTSTFVGSTFNYVDGFHHKGQPLINSEYGGIGALDGDKDVSWSFKFLTNELRRHQQIAAYIYTELHDVEWEHNGFLNYDRTPKQFGYDPRIINESNSLPVNAPPIQKVAPGDVVKVEVASSHYSTRAWQNVVLQWELAGIDTRGRLYQDLARGRAPIPFPHRQVALAKVLELALPSETMLCRLTLTAFSPNGVALARNFVQFLVSLGYPPAREEIERTLVLRGAPHEWTAAEWSLGTESRIKHQAEDCCSGYGHGFFEWDFPLDGIDLTQAKRIKVICEASSHRTDAPQTDEDIWSTTLLVTLNTIPVYTGVLRNHPHDARGALSYWRGGIGAYGYLVKGFAEGNLVEKITQSGSKNSLRLRCAVPEDALAKGGLTIYGAECGRFPITPTVLIEW